MNDLIKKYYQNKTFAKILHLVGGMLVLIYYLWGDYLKAVMPGYKILNITLIIFILSLVLLRESIGYYFNKRKGE